ncbi:MAG: heme-binding domain-containing protein [Acidimicrobiia bacterium]|nr:heme-binding domain-containing protein [Acidimicrobiia bacterium]NNC93258.1 heme-binding domain-containing protein [Acidimicrobiia bacterium]
MLGLLIASGLATWGIYRWRSRSVDPRPVRAPGGTLASSALVAAVVVALAAQAVPYGRDHSNAAITGEPDWATPETRELVKRACFDCHSNEVEWPWYSSIAPLSWAVWKHVKDGRNKVNYSEFDLPQREAEESFKEVKQGSMPPSYYTFGGLHRDANLSDDEMAALLEGLANTPGLSE